MNFNDAMLAVKNGELVTRESWLHPYRAVKQYMRYLRRSAVRSSLVIQYYGEGNMGSETVDSYEYRLDDFEAIDWIILDEWPKGIKPIKDIIERERTNGVRNTSVYRRKQKQKS